MEKESKPMSDDSSIRIHSYPRQSGKVYVSEIAKEVKQLKAEYETAVANGDKSFVFKSQDVLTEYAKYLIEYLENQIRQCQHR